MNPLLLEFGLHPEAAAATSTLMVLFTSSSAALSFGFGHQLNLQFALIFGLCCMGASLVGVILVQRIVKRSGKVRNPDIIMTIKSCMLQRHTCCGLEGKDDQYTREKDCLCLPLTSDTHLQCTHKPSEPSHTSYALHAIVY